MTREQQEVFISNLHNLFTKVQNRSQLNRSLGWLTLAPVILPFAVRGYVTTANLFFGHQIKWSQETMWSLEFYTLPLVLLLGCVWWITRRLSNKQEFAIAWWIANKTDLWTRLHEGSCGLVYNEQRHVLALYRWLTLEVGNISNFLEKTASVLSRDDFQNTPYFVKAWFTKNQLDVSGDEWRTAQNIIIGAYHLRCYLPDGELQVH